MLRSIQRSGSNIGILKQPFNLQQNQYWNLFQFANQGRQAKPLGEVSIEHSKADGKVKEIQNDQQYQDALKGNGQSPRVIQFTASWCGPCQNMKPFIQSYSIDYQTVKFYKIDVDNEAMRPAMLQHNVTGVPTFLLFRGETDGVAACAASGPGPDARIEGSQILDLERGLKLLLQPKDIDDDENS